MKDKSRLLFLGVEDGSVAKNFAKVYGQPLSMLQRSDITEIYFPSPLDARQTTRRPERSFCLWLTS